jgi:hypothetical protein
MFGYLNKYRTEDVTVSHLGKAPIFSHYENKNPLILLSRQAGSKLKELEQGYGQDLNNKDLVELLVTIDDSLWC